jgi:threonine dehydratase
VDAPGGNAWFKLENLQLTGSFKIRGAYNRIAADADARARGVVTASSGNHGRAVAVVAQRLGVRATVCVPDWVDPTKRAAIEAAGAAALLSGPTYEDAEATAVSLARDTGMTFVHPFDDPLVIAGQATLGVELAHQLPADVDTVYVAVSGGGLASGVALGLRHAGHAARIVGVCVDAAPSMRASVLAGHPVEVIESTTLASALSGGIGMANRLTLRLAAALLDEVVLVSDAEIADGIRFAAATLHQVVEGGGATSVAAWLRRGAGRQACVVSGGNIDLGVLAGVLAR